MSQHIEFPPLTECQQFREILFQQFWNIFCAIIQEIKIRFIFQFVQGGNDKIQPVILHHRVRQTKITGNLSQFNAADDMQAVAIGFLCGVVVFHRFFHAFVIAVFFFIIAWGCAIIPLRMPAVQFYMFCNCQCFQAKGNGTAAQSANRSGSIRGISGMGVTINSKHPCSSCLIGS